MALSRDPAEPTKNCDGLRGNFVPAAEIISSCYRGCAGRSVREREQAVNYADRAPARQPVPERGDHLAVSPEPEAAPQDHGNTVAHLRLLWENRRLLFRAALLGLALGLAIAFLIPVRYEATTQLMPPD